MSDDQRTPEWYEQRLGKFTSSAISQLMGIKGLGKTGETYAFTRAVEMFVGSDDEDSYVSFDMMRGIELEPLAFKKLSELLAEDFIKLSSCGFIKLNENTGGSPDGLYSDYGVADIKCPKPDKFFRIVVDNIIDQDYIDQLQHQMWITGRREAISFQYCIFNGIEYWHKIIIPRDQTRIDLMKVRIDEAVILRDNFLAQLKEKKQW